ncbi:collagen-like triple helix repeat-containing protein [Hydrogenophaga palleronii]|uniref:collagen-like triple helix repeat-containing protein n=1 Tax=Hydrogenophaga palleronii TaxID=65655 RepID=UPI0009FD1AAB|nr:collagen-like triple helix repeat-containing protein [Hydrogenophaga palleronii]
MNRTSTKHSHGSKRAGLTVLTMALLTLGGCSGSGSLSSGAGGGGGGGDVPTGVGSVNDPPADNSTPLIAVVREQANSVTAVGQTVSSLNGTVTSATTPLVGSQSAQALGGVVDNAGGVVGAVGSALANGLGQMGNVDNPLGVSAAQLGGAVDSLGNTVSSVGGVVSGLGHNPATAALRPVTDVAGALVDRVGSGVSRVGETLEGQIGTGPTGQLLGAASKVVDTVQGGVVGTTQTVGSVTGLGAPVGRVLAPVAQTLGQAGERVTASNAPGAQGVGQILGNTANTLGHTGNLVSAPASGSPVQQITGTVNSLIVPITTATALVANPVNQATGVGTPLGNLLVNTGTGVQQVGAGLSGGAPQPLGNVVGDTTNLVGGVVTNLGTALGGSNSGGSGTGAGGVLAPVTGLVGGLTNGGLGGGAGATGVLAPVVGAVSGLGNAGGGTPGAGAGAVLAPVLTPVLNTVGALTGGSAPAGAGALAPVTNTLSNTLGGLTGGLGIGVGVGAGVGVNGASRP